MTKIQPIRGSKDILPQEHLIFNEIVSRVKKQAEYFGFQEISVPIIEFTEVFTRTLGDYSDVVTKEMYSFSDRGGDMITLRPELTAGIARSFISNGLTHLLPLKLFTVGPAFRYERPQKARQRQFHQVSFEYLGAENTIDDSQMIALASQIIKAMGLDDIVELQINSLGCMESRKNYQQILVDYLAKYENELSEDSKIRFKKNPLRILDSKDENDKKILQGVPIISDSLTIEARKSFDEVTTQLDLMNIKYNINPYLVRGLDYYSHIVFEFITNKLGAQGTVIAGGRYDGLIEIMGGLPTKATGFAVGIERLMELVNFDLDFPRPVAVIPMEHADMEQAIIITNNLRISGSYAELVTGGGNFSKKMKKANKINARYVIIIGEDERKSGKYQIKNMDNGESTLTPYNDIIKSI